jgi:hypothetical protein
LFAIVWFPSSCEENRVGWAQIALTDFLDRRQPASFDGAVDNRRVGMKIEVAVNCTVIAPIHHPRCRLIADGAPRPLWGCSRVALMVQVAVFATIPDRGSLLAADTAFVQLFHFALTSFLLRPPRAPDCVLRTNFE